MIRVLLLILLCCSCLHLKADRYTYNVLGYEYEDSSRTDIEGMYNTVLSSSIFLNEVRQQDTQAPKLRPQKNKTTVFLISILLLYVFAGVRLMFSHQFTGSLNVLKNMNDKRKAQTETDHISVVSFYALYLMTLGYTTYYFLASYKGFFASMPVLAGVLVCITAVTGLYLLKTALMYFCAWIFDKKQILSQYFLSVGLVYKVAAIILFPLAMLILVSSGSLSVFFLKTALLIFCVAMLMRYIRTAAIMKKLLTVHFLHFFVYLCAFEIIPLLMLYRWLK